MKFAAVDIGNSAIKYCIWEDGQSPRSERREGPEALPEIAGILRQSGIREIGFTTTRDLSAEDRSLIEHAEWWELTAGRNLPIDVRYNSVETLGLDRLAAAVGANKRYPGQTLLIADVGTALTLDIVSADGVYMGGNISMGIDMRLDALHDYTSRLPRVKFEDYPGLTGSDTTSAIILGARWGVVNEIAGTFFLLRKKEDCERILLTGGGAPYINKFLLEALKAWDSPYSVVDNVPLLVEEGIKTAYEYNHKDGK